MSSTLVILGGLVVIVATATGISLAIVVREMRALRREQGLANLLSVFGPAVARVQAAPAELVAWASVAKTARAVHPDLFRELDSATGGRFPFSPELVESSHARWTSQWLAWERDHDLEYKRRARSIESELNRASPDNAVDFHAQLAAIEQEKLQRYQERYEEYVRVGKAIGELE